MCNYEKARLQARVRCDIKVSITKEGVLVKTNAGVYNEIKVVKNKNFNLGLY